MIRRFALLYLVAVSFLVWGFVIGRYQAFPYATVEPIYRQIAEFARQRPEDDRGLVQKLTRHRQIRTNRFSYHGWRVPDTDFIDPGYLLVSRFNDEHNQVIIELVRLSNRQVLHTWIPPIEKILEQAGSDNENNSNGGYAAQHPLILSDGSVVFHSGEGPLVKIDQHSNIQWIINKHFHHSIEMGPDGNLYVPINNQPNLVDLSWVRDDGYAIVTVDGKILKQTSVAQILMRNGHAGIYLGIDNVSSDRVHLNDVQPIHRDSGIAEAGDVAMSCRTLSTVFLYRSSTDQVIWLKTGPWLYQHDINLVHDNQYSIFGNDIYYSDEKVGGQFLHQTGDSSQVYLYNPTTDQVSTPYAAILASLKMRTKTEGRSRILANGDVYIEESNAHRLLRVSKDAVRWEFINTAGNARRTGAVHWCRYLEPDQLNTAWMK